MNLSGTGCLMHSCHVPDHRWSFHSERVQVADCDNSPMSLLTELQAVAPQQLIPPYRYSGEPMALHLDPPLGPLSIAPQVCPTKYIFISYIWFKILKYSLGRVIVICISTAVMFFSFSEETLYD